jgi:hypothetical protein
VTATYRNERFVISWLQSAQIAESERLEIALPAQVAAHRSSSSGVCARPRETGCLCVAPGLRRGSEDEPAGLVQQAFAR